MGERSPLGRWRCRRRAKSLPASDKTAKRFDGAIGFNALEHQKPGGCNRSELNLGSDQSRVIGKECSTDDH